MAKRTYRAASPQESWRPVVGYEGLYEVSDHGQVRRVAPARAATVGYILKPNTDHNGYPRVRLAPAPGQHRLIRVHRLVALAFIGPPPQAHLVNHKDGNKANNHVSNLEWTTYSGNARHALALGLTNPVKGERHGQRAKTHCPRGHAYDEANTYRDAKQYRRCRACHRAAQRARYAAAREAVIA
jgi:NUMOD4 motif/HNH endonuclease